MPSLVYQSRRCSQPVFEPVLRVVWRHEELHLHLLELAHPEGEVAWGDLVAEALSDLGDAERRPLARELQVVLEVQEDPLCRLGPQVDGRAVGLHGSNRRLEHQVELARLRQVTLGRLARALRRLAPASGVLELVGAETELAGAAVDERIGEARQMPARLPCARVLDDRRVERDDVLALLQQRLPPLVLDVVLQQNAVVAVVVARADPPVDLARGEDDAAALAERHDLVHCHDVGGHQVQSG